MFIPGETITQTIYMPFLSSEVSKVLVSYEQFERTVIAKEISSGFTTAPDRAASCYFEVSLSQDDTLQFFDNEPYAIQLNVILRDGSVRCTSVEMKSCTGKQHIRQIYT